jgi:hypothetical protein
MRNEPASYISITPQHRLGAVQMRIEGIELPQHDGRVKIFDTVMVSKEMFL